MRKFLWLIGLDCCWLLWHGMTLHAIICAGLGVTLIELLAWAKKQEGGQ